MKSTQVLFSILAALALLIAAVVFLPGFRAPIQELLSSSAPAESAAAETPKPTDEEAAPDARAPEKLAPLPVQAVVVESAPFVLTVHASGRAEAPRRVELATRVSERIRTVHVNPGERVTRDQVLVELDRRIFEIALKEAEARQANAQVDARVQLLDDPDATANKQELVEHRSGLTEANQGVARARLDLEATRLTAPFDAYVVSVAAVPGGMARADQPILTLVDIGTIRVRAEVLESAFGSLQTGAAVTLRFASLPGEFFSGTITALSPEVDAERGTGIAYIELPNPDGRIKPGMYAEAQLEAATFEDRLAVPREAILERERRLLVFAARSGRAEWLYIETGMETDELVEIVSGVAPGDTILVEGHLTLAHAAPVRVTLRNP